MGEDLHSMMLRQIGVVFDSRKLDVNSIQTDVVNDEEGNEVIVHTVRFLQRRTGTDGAGDDGACIQPRERRRHRV